MTFCGIAYGPDAHVLVTFDGAELLAHDAQTEAPKWKAALEHPVVAVLFADPDALPGGGANPWRSQGGARALLAVDALGAIHGIDPALGQASGKLGPVGKPVAVAAGGGGVVALATESCVYLWRTGIVTELPARASAVAFSNDGGTLAIGEPDGTLRFLAIPIDTSKPPVETSCAVVHGGITDLVQHPDGTWLASGKSGLSKVTSTGAKRLDAVPAKASRLALDTSGKRLAVQLSDRSFQVYAWPSLTIEAEVTYPERFVRGLSFGPENWLGVALDHGDGNKIDIVTSATHRTDTHAGREHRSWLLSVRGKQSILSAKEAEDIRRMKTPFHTPEPERKNGNGSRIGIGAGLSIALLALRLCAAGSRGSSYTPPAYDYSKTTTPTTCDRACAVTRLQTLREECVGHPCEPDARAALAAMGAGDCKRAKASLTKAGSFLSSASSDTHDVLGRAKLLIAESGLTEACASLPALSPKYTALVVLEGKELTATAETIPGADTLEGEEPRTIWAAADGTVFVGTMEGRGRRSFVHRRDKTGTWDVIATRRTTSPVQLWGRSGTDLYILDGDSLAHFDGIKTTEVTPPAPKELALGGIDLEVFVLGESTTDESLDASTGGVLLHRRRGSGGSWTTEATLPRFEVRALWSGGSSLWARAVTADGDNAGDDHLLQRSSSGRWVERAWFGATRPALATIKTVWVSAAGEAFVAADGGVFRSSNGGASWAKTGAPPEVGALWGRSSTDVYATTEKGLMHYDGKSWSSTKYTEPSTVLGGNATQVFVASAASQPDP